MASENSVTLVGNLTKDPELRYTTGGRGVASFGLAVNRRYQVNGEWQEQVSFFNIVAWGDLGENAAASLNKGNRVIVTGRLEQRSYETKEGEKRTVVEMEVDEIGPSLRYATTKVNRTQRSGGGGFGGGGGSQEDPWSSQGSGSGGNQGGNQGGGSWNSGSGSGSGGNQGGGGWGSNQGNQGGQGGQGGGWGAPPAYDEPPF